MLSLQNSAQDRHRANKLAHLINDTASEFGLSFHCSTTDIAANMLAAVIKGYQVKINIGCCAHLLDLAVKDTQVSKTTNFSNLLGRVQDCIKLFKRSEILSSELRKMKNQLLSGSDNKWEFQLPVHTRWNSQLIIGYLVFEIKSSTCILQCSCKIFYRPFGRAESQR